MNVSVIVATYGQEKWKELAIARALPSVYGHDPHETRLHHHYDGTLAEARNHGADSASGDWLLFLDADDELAPGYLDAMRRAWVEHIGPGETVLTNSGPRPTRHPPLAEPALLVPRVQYVHPDGREDEPVFPNRHLPMDMLNHCVIGTLVPRHLFLQVGGFPEGLACYEDWALFLACVRAGATLVDVPDAVYRAHVRPESRNQQALRVRAVAYAKIRRQHLAESRRREVA